MSFDPLGFNVETAAWATFVVLLFTAFFARRAYRIERRSREDRNLLELIKYLQTEDMREARRILLEDIPRLYYYHWIKIPKKRNAAEKVCAAYDMIGLLLKRDFIKEDLVKEWKDSITKCYQAAKPMIDDYSKRSGQDYYENLKYLYEIVKGPKRNGDINKNNDWVKVYPQKRGNTFLFSILTIILLFGSSFNLFICPNSAEYKMLIAAIFTLLVFFTSSFYSIRTMEKQSMIDARFKSKVLSDRLYDLLEKKWCRHYTKDTYCYMFAFLSSLLMLATLLFSIFYTYYFSFFVFFVWGFYIAAALSLWLMMGIRLNYWELEELEEMDHFKKWVDKLHIDCKSIFDDFLNENKRPSDGK